MAERVSKVMVFRESQGAAWVERRTMLWKSLGCSPEIVHAMARLFQFEFANGRIMLAKSAADRPGLVSEIVGTLGAIW
eukprot:3854462-Lingulodinium_polyedra.AAC.1